jgi:hypothetical protein
MKEDLAAIQCKHDLGGGRGVGHNLQRNILFAPHGTDRNNRLIFPLSLEVGLRQLGCGCLVDLNELSH